VPLPWISSTCFSFPGFCNLCVGCPKPLGGTRTELSDAWFLHVSRLCALPCLPFTPKRRSVLTTIPVLVVKLRLQLRGSVAVVYTDKVLSSRLPASYRDFGDSALEGNYMWESASVEQQRETRARFLSRVNAPSELKHVIASNCFIYVTCFKIECVTSDWLCYNTSNVSHNTCKSKVVAVRNKVFQTTPPKLIKPRQESSFGRTSIKLLSSHSKLAKSMFICLNSEIEVYTFCCFKAGNSVPCHDANSYIVTN
jgi:hypothetical protein